MQQEENKNDMPRYNFGGKFPFDYWETVIWLWQTDVSGSGQG